MRKFSTVVAASMAGLLLANTALAQPGPYNSGPRPPGQFQQGPQGQFQQGPQGRFQQGRGPGQDQRSGGQYYYNGRWIDEGEWRRRNAERERWSRNYQQRRTGTDSSALIAGIIGFALGAAIVGSTHEAERARTADDNWRAACARRYRSFDRASGTYMGRDGLRHYCR